MPTLKADYLRKISIEILKAIGTPEDEAEIIADHLIKANLYGHDSHGIIRIPYYLKIIEAGELIKPGAKSRIVNETVSTAVFDGNHNFGQVTGRKAMAIAIEKAYSTGIGMVTLFNVFHTGRVGEYSEMALEHDMIGIVLGGGASARSQVVAPKGLTRLLGTNPIAIAIPAQEERPYCLDMATSIVSGGKISWYLSEGKQVPEGWILDSKGNPTTNPMDFRPPLNKLGQSFGTNTLIQKRGSLLPFGDYKGWNIGIFVQLLGGYLAESGGKGGGFVFIAIDISKFRDVSEFKRNVDKQIRIIKASEKRPGVQEILIAGDPEFYSYKRRVEEGIYIGDEPWNELLKVAENLNVDVKSIQQN